MDSTSRLVVAIAAFVSGAVMVGAMWLPWFMSGSAGRNSFAMFRAAQILGIETITPFRVVWFLLPVVLLAIGTMYVFGLTRAASIVLAVLGAVFVIFGIVALAALGTHAGSAAATVAGLCTIVLAIPGMLKPAA